MPLLPVNKEAEELPLLRAVKRESKAERPRASVIGPEDCLPPPRLSALITRRRRRRRRRRPVLKVDEILPP